MMWKKAREEYWEREPERVTAEAGLQIKIINSRKGPSSALRNALWKTGNTNKNMVIHLLLLYIHTVFIG